MYSGGVFIEKYFEDENNDVWVESGYTSYFLLTFLFCIDPKHSNESLLKQSGTTGGRGSKSFLSD